MLCTAITSSAFAAEDLDLAKAKIYFPPTDKLAFTALYPDKPDSKGAINSFQFKNYSDSGFAIHPKNMHDNYISGVTSREVSGLYGTKDGYRITCYYSYLGFSDQSILLVMRNF